MKHFVIFFSTILICFCLSCRSQKTLEHINPNIEDYLVEMSLGYWDLNYKFPTSYLQSRDTEAWFFSQYSMIDSMLLCHSSELKYLDRDTTLLITYHDSIWAEVNLPCLCEWTDELPLGPRAYDNHGNLILDDFVKIDENGGYSHLTYNLVFELHPVIEKEMNNYGYSLVQDDERKNPQYLLIEYLSNTDSIHLIKACKKYSCFFYDEYAIILKRILSEYCRNNHVAKLLTPVDIYIHKSDTKNK